MAIEVEVLHPKSQRFTQAQAAAVKQRSQHRLGAGHHAQHPLHLINRQDHRNALALGWSPDLLHPGQFDTQYLSVEKEQGVECLPMGGRCHPLLGGQHGQKALNLGLAHVPWMPEAALGAGCPQHKRLGPVDINLLGL